jgi:hypothetical protein
MKVFWWVGIALCFAGGGFVAGMEFQKWRGREPGAGLPSPVSGAHAASTGPSRGRATLVVETTPAVSVTVRVGALSRTARSPVVLAGVPAGRHTLVVEQKGYRRHEEVIELTDGERREVKVRLRDDLGLFYREHVHFPSIRVEVYQDEIDGRVVGIFGRLENRGKRTLQKVQLRLRFLDASGRLRYEDFVHPLLAGGPGADLPLAPGASHNFAVKMPRAPVDVCCEHVDWQVTLIDVK